MADRQTNYWKLGLFVTATVLILFVVLVWFGATRLAGETTTYFAYFDEPVSGLELGSPVKFRGVTIGTVDQIATGPDRRHVEVRAQILSKALERLGLIADAADPTPDGENPLPPDLRVQLVSSVLTGVTYVQSDFFDVKEYPIPDYPFDVPWNTVHSVPSTFKSVESGVVRVFEELPDLTRRTGDLLGQLDRSIAQAELAELSRSARSFLDAATRELDQVRDQQVVARAASAVEAIDGAARALESAAAELSDDQGPLVDSLRRLDALGARLERALDDASISETLAALRGMAAAIEFAADGVGSAGRAIDRESEQLGATIAAIRRLADLLERDPGVLLRGRAPARSPSTTRDRR